MKKYKKYIEVFLKIVLTLILITPVIGSTGMWPPTPDLYNTNEAFEFIKIMMSTYLVYGVALSCFLAIIALWSGRTLLAMLLILPITANVIGFHAFLDGGLFTSGAIMGNIMLIINIYFLYKERNTLVLLLNKY